MGQPTDVLDRTIGTRWFEHVFSFFFALGFTHVHGRPVGLAQGGILPLESFFEGVAVLLLLSEGFFLGAWPLGSMGDCVNVEVIKIKFLDIISIWAHWLSFGRTVNLHIFETWRPLRRSCLERHENSR